MLVSFLRRGVDNPVVCQRISKLVNEGVEPEEYEVVVGSAFRTQGQLAKLLVVFHALSFDLHFPAAAREAGGWVRAYSGLSASQDEEEHGQELHGGRR